VLPAPAALDARPRSQLFELVLADLLSSLFDDAAHKPPSFGLLPTLPTLAMRLMFFPTSPAHGGDERAALQTKGLSRRIK
jgi:hypothetical protein